MSATEPSLSAVARQVLSAKTVETGMVVNKNDSRYPVLLGPINHGNAAIGVIAIFEDMTALTNITNRMKGSQQLSIELDTIIDSSNDGLWICDGNGVVVNERDITKITRLQEQLKENAEIAEQYKQDMLEKQIEETESRQIIANSANFQNIVQKAIKLA